MQAPGILESRKFRAWTRPKHRSERAARVHSRWEFAIVAALVLTIPAYYLSLLEPGPSWHVPLPYAIAAMVLLAGLAHTARCTGAANAHWRANLLDLVLAAGLLAAALLPSSAESAQAWVWRSLVAALILLRLTWSLLPHLYPGGLVRLTLLALVVFGACGAGFWWLEPRAANFGDGLWLAFTTAATVGYGDIVPTTAASKIFSVFVVLLGYAVISLVTAAIAAMWVETQERRIEREILQDLHRQLQSVHRELAELRTELRNGVSRSSAGDQGA